MQRDYRRSAVGKLEEICSFVLREAEKKGADYCEAYGVSNKESEVFIENNDLKQCKVSPDWWIGNQSVCK